MTINWWETKSQDVFYMRTSCLSVLWILSGIHVELPSVNLCKHFYSIVKYNKINPCQLRATSFLRLLWKTELFSFLPFSLPHHTFFPPPLHSFYFGGRMSMYCSKKTLFLALLHFFFWEKVWAQPVPFIFMNFGYIFLGLGLPHC